MRRLEGQAALVTGGGRGIGRAIALAFAREGARCAVAARTARELDVVVEAVRAGGGEALAVPTDVTREAEVAHLVRTVLERFGRLDILVTSAGTGAFAPVRVSRLEDWEEMIAVNLTGTYLACRAALEPMLRQGRGTIINVISLAALRPIPGTSGYTAAKAGALGFTRVLAEEVRRQGIRVAALCPGAVDTPFWDAIDQPPDRSRMLRPEAVAEAALLVASQPPGATVEEVVLAPAEGIL